jgi:hypothetical protein
MEPAISQSEWSCLSESERRNFMNFCFFVRRAYDEVVAPERMTLPQFVPRNRLNVQCDCKSIDRRQSSELDELD